MRNEERPLDEPLVGRRFLRDLDKGFYDVGRKRREWRTRRLPPKAASDCECVYDRGWDWTDHILTMLAIRQHMSPMELQVFQMMFNTSDPDSPRGVALVTGYTPRQVRHAKERVLKKIAKVVRP
jgi:hypothetical protein